MIPRTVLDVARRHGTSVAADWSGYSRSAVLKWRREVDGYTRGRGRPTRAEVIAARPSHACPCRRCADWRAERDLLRQALIDQVAEDVAGTDEEWRTHAACLGEPPELFFPERGASAEEALAICDRCPVAEPCLDDALANAFHGMDIGIRGGTSARERRRIRRRKKAAA